MKTYRIVNEDDPALVGKIEGVQVYVNIDDPLGSQFRSGGATPLPDNGTIFNCFWLAKNAKVTDFLSVDSNQNHFIVSEKLKSLFQKLNVPIRFYRAILKREGSEELIDNYFVGWLEDDSISNLDFKRMTFICKKGMIVSKEYEFQATDEMDLLEKAKEFVSSGGIVTFAPKEKYFFCVDLPPSHVFRLGIIDRWIYASKLVKDRVAQNDVSGMNFLESNFF